MREARGISAVPLARQTAEGGKPVHYIPSALLAPAFRFHYRAGFSPGQLGGGGGEESHYTKLRGLTRPNGLLYCAKYTVTIMDTFHGQLLDSLGTSSFS